MKLPRCSRCAEVDSMGQWIFAYPRRSQGEPQFIKCAFCGFSTAHHRLRKHAIAEWVSLNATAEAAK